MKNDAVILLSGGMDSAVCAGIAIDRGYKPAAMHLNYGQRTQVRELKAFNDICDYYKIGRRLSVDVRHLAIIGGSSLTDRSIEISPANLESGEIPSSYVPFRNANIMAIAVSWAEVLGAEAMFIGAMEEDSSGYPDCRKSFFEAFQQVINLGTKPETNIRLETPIIDMQKKEVVLLGEKLGTPFHLTWSCYKSEELACGECDSCALRLRGFMLAGIKDKISYAKKQG